MSGIGSSCSLIDIVGRFKTVGELRTADLDEVSRQRQNFESQLHSQEDEVTAFAIALGTSGAYTSIPVYR